MPYGPQHYVFICQLLTLQPAGLVQVHKETESSLLVNNVRDLLSIHSWPGVSCICIVGAIGWER